MDDMGDMEMDMESMMGGGDGVKTGDGANLPVVTLSNIEQSCLALQQMGMILSEFCLILQGVYSKADSDIGLLSA